MAILETLSEPELQHLKSRQLQNLSALAAPDLTAMSHRAMALRVGHIHAIVGLDSEDLVRGKGILFAAILDTVDATGHGAALSVLGQRLTRDLAWQTEAYHRVQTSRQDVSDALQMYYQPLLDLKTWQITKVEALARLRDGERLLTPGEFFPALSPDDFLELYVRGLGQALSQRHHWLQGGIDLNVSVNLPSSALGDMRYFEATRQVLAEYGCAPGRLTLEILETDALPPGINVSQELAKFKALGVMLAEDDLGSGHSSLNRLRELPFDCVKIDRNIVSLAGQDASNVLRFIYQLTRLGRSLGKSVIVEGVEDTGMLEAILVLGADVAQGYAIARPMPAQQLTAWIGSQPGLPDTLRPKSALGKLARLLIWEERMHLISGDPHASATLADISTTPANPDAIALAGPAPLDSACQVCPLPDFFLGMQSLLPDGFPGAPVKQALIAVAVSHGPDSVAYRSAREQLVTTIMSESVQH